MSIWQGCNQKPRKMNYQSDLRPHRRPAESSGGAGGLRAAGPRTAGEQLACGSREVNREVAMA